MVIFGIQKIDRCLDLISVEIKVEKTLSVVVRGAVAGRHSEQETVFCSQLYSFYGFAPASGSRGRGFRAEAGRWYRHLFVRMAF